jgi:hypothetical protein
MRANHAVRGCTDKAKSWQRHLPTPVMYGFKMDTFLTADCAEEDGFTRIFWLVYPRFSVKICVIRGKITIDSHSCVCRDIVPQSTLLIRVIKRGSRRLDYFLPEKV